MGSILIDLPPLLAGAKLSPTRGGLRWAGNLAFGCGLEQDSRRQPQRRWRGELSSACTILL